MGRDMERREDRPIGRLGQEGGGRDRIQHMLDPNPRPVALAQASQICTSDFFGTDSRSLLGAVGV